MYTQEKKNKVIEIMNFKRVYRDFLHAIKRLTLIFVEMYDAIIDLVASTTNYKAQLFIVIEKLRHNIRLKKTRKKKTFTFSSAFVADENNESNKSEDNKFKSSKNISFRDDIKLTSICICDQKHYYVDYLYLNKTKRFIDWKADSNVKKMKETFKYFEIKKRIEKSKVNAVRLTVKSKDNLKNDDKKNEENIEIFSVDLRKSSQSDVFFSQFLYDLRFSWVINHDFNIHVVNNIMKKRSIKERNYIDDFTIISDNKSLFIKIYDRTKINVKTLNEKNIMTLINVIYVSNFMINVVAENILEDKELHFDIQHRHLHRNDFVVILMLRAEAHYIFENDKESEKMTAFVIFIRADITHD